MAASSKAWVHSCSLAGIVGSNPAGGLDMMSGSCECCVGRADRSSRGVLPNVVCLSVIVKLR